MIQENLNISGDTSEQIFTKNCDVGRTFSISTVYIVKFSLKQTLAE
jgi:hypothetical protein